MSTAALAADESSNLVAILQNYLSNAESLSFQFETSEDSRKALLSLGKQNFAAAILASTKAVTQFRQILRHIQNEFIESHILRAKAYLAQKKYYMAKQDCDFAMANGRLDGEVVFLLAQSLEGLCLIESAEEAYRKALTLNPNLIEAKIRLQNSLHARNQMPPVPLDQRLPDEIWVKIFSNLDVRSRVRCESVCRKWATLSKMAWSRIRSFPPPDSCLDAQQQQQHRTIPYTPDFFCGLLSRCGRFVTSIDLNAVEVSRVRLEGVGRFRLRNKLSQLLQVMATNCPSLEHLIVPTAAFLDEDLSFIFRHFRELKSMCLEKVGRTPEGRLTGEALGELPPRLEDLRLHFVQSCPCLVDAALGQLAQRGAGYLKHLKLFSEWDSFPSESALINLISQCENLRSVKLGCLGRQASESLTTTCLEQLGRLSQLSDLYVWAPRITASVITSIVQGCPKLSSLELHAENMEAEALTRVSNFKGLSDLRLDVINGIPWGSLLPMYAAHNQGTLKIMALNGLHSVELFLILQSFPALEQLCLWNSVDISAQTLVDLIVQNHSRPNPLKLTASCYHIQMSEPLAIALRDNSTNFAVGCYYDHHPCDLNSFTMRTTLREA